MLLLMAVLYGAGPSLTNKKAERRNETLGNAVTPSSSEPELREGVLYGTCPRGILRGSPLSLSGMQMEHLVRDLPDNVEEANLAVTEKRTDPSGTLNITVPAGISRLHVAPASLPFRCSIPKFGS